LGTPDLLVSVFLAKALGRLDRWPEAQALESSIRSRFEKERAWGGRADTTSYALNVLQGLARHGGAGPTPEMDTIGRRLILESAVPSGGPEYVSWCGRVSSTAYTIVNIAESALWDDESLRDRCRRAANWIRSRQASGHWPVEDPPYGGATEITAHCYYTAVAIRGMLAYGISANPAFLMEVQHAIGRFTETRARKHEAELLKRIEAESQGALILRKRAAMWRLSAILLIMALLVVVILRYRDKFNISTAWTLGLFGVLGGIAAMIQLAEYAGRLKVRMLKGDRPKPPADA
jgi:hypothetical protein